MNTGELIMKNTREININKQEAWELSLSLQHFISCLEDEIKNKPSYLIDYNGNIPQKTLDSHAKKINELNKLQDKVFKEYLKLKEVQNV